MSDFRVFMILTSVLLAGCAGAQPRPGPDPRAAVDSFLADQALVGRVRALDAENVSATDVSEVLSKCPAPRLYAFNGTAFNTMAPFARFLRKMGYPDVQVRSSWGDTAPFVRELEQDASPLRPILIGHSRGGAFVVKTLHQLKERRVSFAAAVATGKWMRVLLGQWDTLPILRRVPATAEEFAGYRLKGDWIGSDAFLTKRSGEYEAHGDVRVRNVVLDGPGHLDVTDIESFADQASARDRLDRWRPGTPVPETEQRFLFAAHIWYHVKKHWCLEVQRLIDGG